MFPKIFSNTSKSNEETQPSTTSATDTDDQNLNQQDNTSEGVSKNTQQSTPTKMQQAMDIYRQMTRKKSATRKEIVAAFIEKVGLTKAGAATYYQMINKKRRKD